MSEVLSIFNERKNFPSNKHKFVKNKDTKVKNGSF